MVQEGQPIPTFVIPVVLEVYKHGVHIGLLLYILQCCSQTRGQREELQLMFSELKIQTPTWNRRNLTAPFFLT